MPVLYNPQGLAENLPQEAVEPSLAKGYQLPLISPEGEHVMVPDWNAYDAAVKGGHAVPNNEQLRSLLDHAKYSAPLEQGKAFLEGAGEGATLGLSTGVERALGVDPKAIQGRRDANPGTQAIGQGVGLAATNLIPGYGEYADAQTSAKLARTAFEEGMIGAEEYGLYKTAAAEALNPLSASSVTSKVGNAVETAAGLAGTKTGAGVKAATEMALLQSGDEVSKMFAQDPDQTLQTAVADMSLAGVLGMVGGAGAEGIGRGLSKVLNKAKDSELGQLLSTMRAKANATPLGPELKAPAEIRAALEGDPRAQDLVRALSVSPTEAGTQVKQALDTYRNDTVEQLVEGLGFKRAEAEGLGNLSEHEVGRTIKGAFVKELKAQAEPISEQLNAAKAGVADSEIGVDRRAAIQNDLEALRQSEGYHKAPSSPHNKLISQAIEELPLQTSATDLGKYASRIYEQTGDPKMYRLGGQMREIFKGHEEDAIVEALKASGKSPESLEALASARKGYAGLKDQIETLNGELHAGRYAGPESFARAVEENLTNEDFLRRIGAKDNAHFTAMLQEKFPETAQAIRDFQLKDLIGTAVGKARQGEWINHTQLFKEIEKLSPEHRAFLLGAEGEARVMQAQQALALLPAPAKAPVGQTLERVIKQIPNGLASMIGWATGHGMAGSIADSLHGFALKGTPDQFRLAFLRFLGHEGEHEANPAAFRALVKLVGSIQRAEMTLDSAVKAVVGGSKVTIPHTEITPFQIEKLEKQVAQLQSTFGEDDNDHFHYAAGEGQSAGLVVGQAAQILQAAKPKTAPTGPFAPERKPSPSEETAYRNTVALLNQPLLALDKMGAGTLTAKDVQVIKQVYPALHARISSKLMSEMADKHAKGETVPFALRLSVSRFINEPLDATLAPQAIAATQATFAPEAPPPGMGAPKPSKSGAGKIKAGEMATLPTDAAAQRKQRAH